MGGIMMIPLDKTIDNLKKLSVQQYTEIAEQIEEAANEITEKEALVANQYFNNIYPELFKKLANG